MAKKFNNWRVQVLRPRLPNNSDIDPPLRVSEYCLLLIIWAWAALLWVFSNTSTLHVSSHILHLNICSRSLCFFITSKYEYVILQCLHFRSSLLSFSVWWTRSLWTFRPVSVLNTKWLQFIHFELITGILYEMSLVLLFLWQSWSSSNSLLSLTNSCLSSFSEGYLPNLFVLSFVFSCLKKFISC